MIMSFKVKMHAALENVLESISKTEHASRPRDIKLHYDAKHDRVEGTAKVTILIYQTSETLRPTINTAR